MSAMAIVTQFFRDTLRDIWADLWTALVVNLLWTLSLCLLIPGPPATLALFYYGSRLAKGEVTDLNDFWWAFRHYWGPGWRWGAINLLVIGLLAGDAILTEQLSTAGLAPFVQGFYLAALAGWLVVQLYALSFLFEQDRLSVRQALRNAAVMAGKNPGFTLALAGLLGLVFVFGTLLFMLSFAFGGVILAGMATRAVQNRLETQRQAT